ncbi:MAG: BMP family ABC transporter substrate-binding protein [Eubacterium sp.]|nr:BMP family ABC transporter substrate-binding protein [Eubacterium sp.]
MKKRLLSIILVGAMAIACLAGCGSEGGNEGGAGSAAGEGTGSAIASMEDIVVGEIQSYVINDGGWCQATHEGLVAAMENAGIPAGNLMTLEEVYEEQAAVYAATEQLIEEGANVIVGTSTGYSGYLAELKAEYPDVTFIQYGTEVEGLASFALRSYEAMFVAGAVCEMMSMADGGNAQLGFSASMDEFSVNTAINAYALGAQYINPEATVKVACADSWYDVDKETQCAQSLIDAGIKYMGMEASSPAIPQTCEKNGAYCVGYHIDMSEYAPEAVLFSFTWNFAPIFETIFADIVAGNVQSMYYMGGECAALTDFSDKVPADVQTKAAEIQAGIADGTINVYGGPLADRDGNELVAEGAVMDDNAILLQEFYVNGVDCAW